MDLESVSLASQELVLSIFESSPSYFLRVEGRLPSLNTVTEAILGEPTRKHRNYKKEFIVIREERRPIATAELHVHHPESSISYLGLLLVREDLRGQGRGRRCYLAIEKHLRDRHDCLTIRLGVSDDNDVSGFWSKLGFRSNGRSYQYHGESKISHVVEYEKKIGWR